MMFGSKIRQLREEQGLLQRQLAAALEIDTPMYSKIERGDRRAKRSQVILLAELLHVDKDELLTIWLADKILDAIADEPDYALPAIDIVDSQLQSQSMHL
jgi:transcriptional regulator with XRE-family HTH domain